MHIHFEKSVKAECDCTVLSMSWMGKVPDDLPEDEGWKLNRTHYYQEGWLATGNVRGILGVTFTTSHWRKNSNELPVRTNYNLRGHRAQITLVQWNEPYQKLASCDSSGIIFVWIKYEGRWSIELINDRSTPVTHFSWSHDGRMALICYQDGFVLVGSVAGQRYWSSMLNLDATITCGIWTPDDQQVYFGTSNAQVIVMDVHGAMVSQVQLPIDSTIRSMAWSCEKFKMEENEEGEPSSSSHFSSKKEPFLLAISFKSGLVYLMKHYDDVAPIHIWTGMQSSIMEWSNSGEYLAVAGSRPVESINEAGQRTHEYFNSLHFYNHKGVRVLNITIPATSSPVTALTWGHNDKRIFAATGKTIHVGWVSKRIASLQLLCRLAIYKSLSSKSCVAHLPLPLPVRALITSLHTQTILSVLPNLDDLREFVSHPPGGNLRLYCTMIRHEEDANQSPGTAYTLYLEYLGGLIPILKGKRTSKIRPEFVIYDPQSSDGSNYLALCGGSNTKRAAESNTKVPGTPHLGGRYSPPMNDLDASLLFTDSSESEDVELCASPHMQRRRYRHRIRERERERLRAQEREWERNRNGGPPIIPDPTQMLNPQQLLYNDVLPESSRLVAVTSNIWGTKFKIHGLANSLPDNLGQVTYKTSLLHLQPRQMTLLITELRDDIFLSPESVLHNQIFRGDDEEEFTVIVNPDEIGGAGSITTNISSSPPPPAQNRCFLQPRGLYEGLWKDEHDEASDEPHEMHFRTLRSSLKSPLSTRRKSHEPLSVRVTTTADVLQARPGCSRRVDYEDSQPGPSSPNVLSPTRASWITTPNGAPAGPSRINVCPTTTSPPAIHVRRSFSASVLDSVENAAALSLDIVAEELRATEPKRLVLVKKRPPGANPLLKECGKSKSWDSCELSGWIRQHRNEKLESETNKCPKCSFPAVPLVKETTNRCLPHVVASPLPNPKTPRRRSSNLCRSNGIPIPIPPTPKLRQKRNSICKEDRIERASESSESSDVYRPTSTPSPSPPPAPTHRRSISLLTPLLKRRELASRNRSDSNAGVTLNPKSAPFVAPGSPQHQPRSSPNTPAMGRKSFSKDSQHRYLHSAPSPLRQLFINSPLFPRRLRNSLDPTAIRNQRKNSRQDYNNPALLDSSDEEDDDVSASGGGSSAVSMTPGRQSFRLNGQSNDAGRSQLRQKLSKKKIHNVENSPIVPRRMQFVMHNKAPMWNENSQVYQLDFGGRVTQESAKNFQIEFRGKQVMQFGRIDGNAYTLDFQYPFSALQAFAVALANVTQRLK